MNEHEYSLKHFFDFPEKQIKNLLHQLSVETGFEFEWKNVDTWELLTSGEEPNTKNIGVSLVLTNAVGVIPVEGTLNHKIGKIKFSIWSKSLTLMLE